MTTTHGIKNSVPSKKSDPPVATPFRASPLPRAAALAVLTGALLFLSFPTWELYPLAWIAFVPLFFAIQKQTLSRAFFLGWIAGLVYFAGTLSWVTISMHNYGKIPWTISYLIMLLLVAYLAVYVGVFTGVLTYLFPGWSGPALFFAPALWSALEFTRGHLMTGFPWSNLGYSQYRFLPMIQIADIASVYGVGFVILLVNAALFIAIKISLKDRRAAWRPFLVGLSAVVLTFLYGLFRLSQPMESPRSIAVAVIQGNIEQEKKWDAQFREETIGIYRKLSLESLKKGSPPELVVWPESAAPFFFQSEAVYRDTLLRLARDGSFHLLFGSPAFKPAPAGQVALLNSAYMVSPTKGVTARYDKIHLVPFGEYVPLSSLLFFVNKMVEGIGEFIPGEDPLVMETPSAKVGTVICFEVIFPEVVRRFVDKGAEVMTTITNDAWFGNSAAPYQHFSMVVFRSIENRVPFARAANTGISGFIDAHGRIKETSPLFVQAALSEVLHPGFRRTLYTAYGDFFAIACVIITLLSAAFVYQNRRKTDAH